MSEECARYAGTDTALLLFVAKSLTKARRYSYIEDILDYSGRKREKILRGNYTLCKSFVLIYLKVHPEID